MNIKQRSSSHILRLLMVTFFAVGLLAGCGGGGGGSETPPNEDPPPLNDDTDDNNEDAGDDDDDNSDDDTNGDGGGGSVDAFSTPQFFIGNDGSSGNTSDGSQLWITDGTENNTNLVKAIFPGDDAKMRDFTSVGDKLFFVADDGDGHGEQLWVSDGTTDGTARLTDSTELDDGAASLLTALGNTLYFRGRGPGGDPWLWTSDGTAEGTEVVGTPTNNGVKLLTAFKEHVYFVTSDNTTGMELWRSDGTENNTELLVEIPSSASLGSMYGCADRLVEMDAMLYFLADESNDECGLWRTNGDLDHAEQVKTVSNKFTNDHTHMVSSNGKLYFFANAGNELWVSDGTEAGTAIALESDDDTSLLRTNKENPLLAADDYAYFQVYNRNKDSSEGLELWYTDGSESGLVVALGRNVSGDGLEMAVAGDYLFYVHNRPDLDSDFTTPNRGLWRASGDSIELLHSGYTGTNGGEPLIPVANDQTLLFSSMGEVWRTDGTESGTVFVKDICPGTCFGFFGP